MPPRRTRNPVRCSLPHSRRHSMLDQSRLLLEPPAHPSLSFLLGNHLSTVCGIEALLDLLTDIDVVLNVIERGIIGKFLKKGTHLLLGCLHSAYLHWQHSTLKTGL